MKFLSPQRVLYFSSSLFSLSAMAAPSPATVEAWLRKFEADPAAVSAAPIPKTGASASTVFSNQDVANRSFIAKKNKARLEQFPSAQDGRAAIEANDQPQDLVDNGDKLIRKLKAMEKLKEASLAETPWSDTYWPIYAGVLGIRYADSEFMNASVLSSFKNTYDYTIVQKPAWKLDLGDGLAIDLLSPAEKYDLLIGDHNFTFTKANWNVGKRSAGADGEVEKWMGICHGWAPAAYMYARPKHTVEALAADGKTKLTFYPSDIKALSSLLWANVRVPNAFIGGRCNVKTPKTDAATGRVTDQDCFDTNPGAFHLAVVNQIGVSKRSMVMDATFDYEVWNQPIYSYSYAYFNPSTQKTGTLKQSTVETADFAKDKYKKFRSPKARSIVGVAMNLTYVVETTPTHAKTDSKDSDATKTVLYYYDLELDADGNVIGGEWYQQAHPDFLWTPVKGSKPATAYDKQLRAKWDPAKGQSLPSDWQEAGQRSAAAQTPIAKIVEALVKAAQ